MARYTAKKRKTELTEYQERVLMAMHALSVQCEVCLHVQPGGVGGIFVPGRAISKVMGGKWTSWRHKQMLLLQDDKWVIANLGFEQGSTLKQVWRYGLTESARVTMLERMASAQKDCIWLGEGAFTLQPELFAS
jgi:hypothetical protein